MVTGGAGGGERGAAELLVTTAPDAPAALIARARVIAKRCGALFSPRRASVTRLLRDTGRVHAYIVGRERDELRGGDEILWVHPGLFYLKREAGATHPLLRALAPEGEPPPRAIVDATLGLAGDAIHVASALGARVIGCEASPVLASLLEEGLPRLAKGGRGWSEGAARVELRAGDALATLSGLEEGAVDAVYLDPMFEAPLAAQAGFDLLRAYAVHAPVDAALLAEAWRVAARRVVLKLPGMAAPPEGAPGPGWTRRVRGQAVDYAILER
ncbi:MAG: class I SAM-dependent methyltransferase [Myxococcales bacterium]|nr:class I SAM-dependent methyltransferase [Myxococcales bacterium]